MPCATPDPADGFDIAAFIASRLPLSPVALVPEIRLHQAVPTSGLRALARRDPEFGNPYWAYPWGGGLALARYLLDHRATVIGKTVLDLGCGSGLVAIAAALRGAQRVIAADVDPYAIVATRLNAAANGVAVETFLGDLADEALIAMVDTLLIGDLFYDADTARILSDLIARWRTDGVDILIGDPRRAFLPAEALDEVAAYPLPGTTAEGAARVGCVFRVR